MLNFVNAKLLVDFWACVTPIKSIAHTMNAGDLVKLKIEGVSANEMDWPPPVVFNDYLWVRVTSVKDEFCYGTIISKLDHVNAWMVADMFNHETEAVFNLRQVYEIKGKNI